VNTAKFEAVSRSKEDPSLDPLIDPVRLRAILKECAAEIIGPGEDILSVKIKPLKVYRDSISFSFIAVYDLEVKGYKGITRVKHVYASSHSHKDREPEYQANKKIFNSVLAKPAHVLRIPQPYCFIKSHNLFLREYINGPTLAELIAKNRGLPLPVYELLASALVEFQKIGMTSLSFKTEKTMFSLESIQKNLLILKKNDNSQWRSVKVRFDRLKNSFDLIFDQAEERVLSHGDLNPSNIILIRGNDNEDNIVFIDFNSTGLRHYLWDIAAFSSHLRTLVKAASTDMEAKTQQKIFLDAYLKKSGRSPILNENERRLFDIFQEYFDLLNLTHFLVWG
jgi:thiamine kinase-like enzyme